MRANQASLTHLKQVSRAYAFAPYPTVWCFFRSTEERGLWDGILREAVKQ